MSQSPTPEFAATFRTRHTAPTPTVRAAPAIKTMRVIGLNAHTNLIGEGSHERAENRLEKRRGIQEATNFTCKKYTSKCISTCIFERGS